VNRLDLPARLPKLVDIAGLSDRGYYLIHFFRSGILPFSIIGPADRKDRRDQNRRSRRRPAAEIAISAEDFEDDRFPCTKNLFHAFDYAAAVRGSSSSGGPGKYQVR